MTEEFFKVRIEGPRNIVKILYEDEWLTLGKLAKVLGVKHQTMRKRFETHGASVEHLLKEVTNTVPKIRIPRIVSRTPGTLISTLTRKAFGRKLVVCPDTKERPTLSQCIKCGLCKLRF